MGKKNLILFLLLLLSSVCFSQINNVQYFKDDVWFKDTVHFKNTADTVSLYLYNHKIYYKANSSSIDTILFLKSDGVTPLKTNLAGSGGGSGTVTSVATSSPITGGTITGSGTIAADTSAKDAALATNYKIRTTDSVGTITYGVWAALPSALNGKLLYDSAGYMVPAFDASYSYNTHTLLLNELNNFNVNTSNYSNGLFSIQNAGGYVGVGDYAGDHNATEIFIEDSIARITFNALNGVYFPTIKAGTWNGTAIDTAYGNFVKNVTAGSGITVTTEAGTKKISTTGNLTIGTTTITSGSNNQALYDSAAVVRESSVVKIGTAPGITITPNNSGSVGLALKANASQATQTMFTLRNSSNTLGLYFDIDANGTGLITSVNQAPTDPSASVISAGASYGLNGSANNFYGIGLGAAVSSKYPIWFQTGASNGGGYSFYTSGANLRMALTTSGQLGIGVAHASITANLHIKAGTASANTAPLKFTSGTNLTTAEIGAIEYDGNQLYLDSTAARFTIDKGYRGSATLDFGSTLTLNSSDLTITVTGAVIGDIVCLGVPNGSVNANTCFTAWVSSANTVTVRFNNYSVGSVDPASGTFRASIIR